MNHPRPLTTIRVGIIAGIVATSALVSGIVAKPAPPAPAKSAPNDNADAVYVGEAVCIACHAPQNKQFTHTQHANVFRLNPKNEREKLSCEACHGPGSNHLKDPANPLLQ